MAAIIAKIIMIAIIIGGALFLSVMLDGVIFADQPVVDKKIKAVGSDTINIVEPDEVQRVANSLSRDNDKLRSRIEKLEHELRQLKKQINRLATKVKALE